MMRNVRIIPRLDIKGPNVVKGINLEGLRVVGKPAELARKYYNQGADELIYIDIVASLYNRNNLAHIVEETTRKDVFIPITVGGGIRSIDDITKILRSGADKVAINTAAIKNPQLLREASRIFGSSTIVLSIEAKRITNGKWEAYIDNGRQRTGVDVMEWVSKALDLGVGEILLTSVDHEGMRKGYDMELINALTQITDVPVIASGGAGNLEHVEECMLNKKVDGIAIASLFHYGEWTVNSLKEELSKRQNGRIKNYYEYDTNFTNKTQADVSIVDYNLGNLRSIENALKHVGARPRLVSTAQDILNSKYLVLPGVGAFEEGMKHLNKGNMDQAIIEYAKSGRPLLGICLGMQLLMEKSYEFGDHKGLGLIEGEVISFEKSKEMAKDGYKVPHVGWNRIYSPVTWKGTILDVSEGFMDMYFIHSFYVKPRDNADILATTRYYNYEFCSAVKKDNIYGCQFHPEKSGKLGLGILRKFLG